MTKNLVSANAAYRIISQENGSFGIEISIEDTCPTTVTSFATETAAEAWIHGHKARVLNPPFSRGHWRTRAKAV